eukprot:TRINITY_DN11576_c0_g1_i4.p1 TRINITY_DN11576_c0_g1~~TRINITY_DN11576_c0_g1_i4.p1  ORF type:complete len:439 (+),score=119.80 TRINITY_DN11576_c0_g1_i4:105-1319(+)
MLRSLVGSEMCIRDRGEMDGFGRVMLSSEFRRLERKSDPDLQEHLDKTFQELIKKLHPQQIAEWVWPFLLKRAELALLTDSPPGPKVLPVLCEAIARVAPDALHGDLGGKLVEWTSVSSAKNSKLRFLGCQALGAVTRRTQLEPEMVQHCLELCQDSDYDIRAEMCSKWIPSAVKGLDLKVFTTTVLPELLELIEDEMPDVRQAAYLCIIDTMPFLHKQTLVSRLLPKVQEMVRENFQEMNRVKCIASLGPLAVKLKEVFGHSGYDPKQGGPRFVEILSPMQPVFMSTLTDQDQQVRLASCRNLPAMVSIFCKAGWNLQAAEAVSTFASDMADPVRATLAAGLHHVATCARREGEVLLAAAQEACQLLANDSVGEVRQALLGELGVVLVTLFVQNKPSPMVEES